MDWRSIEQNWNLFQRRIRQKWEKLSDEDLEAIDGRRDHLEQKIQSRYEFAADFVHKEVDNWLRWQTTRTTEACCFHNEARRTHPLAILADYLGIESRGAVSLLVAPSPCALPLTPAPPWSSEFGLGS